MISMFHVFAALVCLVGLVGGAVYGARTFGFLGGVVGALLGAYLGLALGRIPRVITELVVERQQRKTAAAKNQIRKPTGT
jgi:hypothetical protein